MSGNDLTEIKIALARMEERQLAMAERVSELATKTDVSQLAQIVSKEDARIAELLSKDTEDLEKRVTTLESNQTWVTRSVAGIVIAGLAGLLGFAKKTGM